MAYNTVFGPTGATVCGESGKPIVTFHGSLVEAPDGCSWMTPKGNRWTRAQEGHLRIEVPEYNVVSTVFHPEA